MFSGGGGAIKFKLKLLTALDITNGCCYRKLKSWILEYSHARPLGAA